ncbi:hypothetical protein FJT64_015613 [Amphibalanus amphitrite]|uniref:Uncharacterized protein n=1 Tax=Amphibalanus amphitrite TaxID=1232801 RepID=A0A6A4X8P8_AMPAM|nr:hypothetical protein FJT64_015613 [Amphibalanus amphitrite]
MTGTDPRLTCLRPLVRLGASDAAGSPAALLRHPLRSVGAPCRGQLLSAGALRSGGGGGMAAPAPGRL